MAHEATVEGTGKTLEEAVAAALKNVPKQAGADILVTLKIVEWGFKSGGIVGFADYWVKATYE